ncbi:MAG: SUMF1/EgtB/PvdO family nonheme iron enzyme [Candidatus Eisenbacteria bacterium]
MVLIPAGEFEMGKDGTGDYSPAHKVQVDSFYIDRHEVTNAQYFEFCQATNRPLPEFWGMKEFHCVGFRCARDVKPAGGAGDAGGKAGRAHE